MPWGTFVRSRKRAPGDGGYVTVPEVARALSVKPGTVRKWLDTGRLTGTRAPGMPGSERAGNWRVSTAEFERFVRAQGRHG